MRVRLSTPGAVAGLDDVGAAQVARSMVCVAPEGVRGTRKIEGDARRVGHAEARRRAGERLAQGQAHVDRAALFGDLQRLDPVVEALRLRRVPGSARQARAPRGLRKRLRSAALRCGVSFSCLPALLQCQRAGPFNPVAIDILDQFAQLDLVLGDQSDHAEILSHVVPGLHLMEHGPALTSAWVLFPSARPPSAAIQAGRPRAARGGDRGRAQRAAEARRSGSMRALRKDRPPAFPHRRRPRPGAIRARAHRAAHGLGLLAHPGLEVVLATPAQPASSIQAPINTALFIICSPASRPAPPALLRELFLVEVAVGDRLGLQL